MKKIKILIDENKNLTGYSVHGALPNSIELELDDDFKFVGNLNDYKYTGDGLLYEPNLEKLKRKKIEELKRIRDEKCKENLEMGGSLFQVRNTEDRGKFDRILLGIVAQVLNPQDKEEWRLADNTYKNFTYRELAQIPKLYSDREREIFKKFKELDMRLQKSNSSEEIEKINWN